MPGGLKLSTGVLVMYADEESFTLMTPQGHMFAGWITFSAFEDDDGVTCAQAQVLMRASDPLYEIGMTMGGHGQEDRHWEHTLRELARHFGVEGEVDAPSRCASTGGASGRTRRTCGRTPASARHPHDRRADRASLRKPFRRG